MNRYYFAISAVIVALLLGTFAPTSHVPRARACNPGRSVYDSTFFDGWYRSAGGITVGGVYAKIENLDVYVVPGNQGTSAWVMLTRTGESVWAQIGWVKKGDGSRNTLIQVKNSSTSVTTRDWDPAKPLGSYPYYTVLYDNTPGTFTFQLDGSPWPYAGYSVAAGFTPTEGQIFGEIKNNNNQMPGATSDVLGFFSAYTYYLGSWHTFLGNAYSSHYSDFPYDGPYSGTTLYIWDADCASNG